MSTFRQQKFLRHPLSLSILMVLALSPSFSYAEDATTTQLETINVKSETSSALETATGLKLKPKETPQSISVITQEQIKDQGISSLSKALKQTTGINVIRDSGRYRFQSRGFYIDQIEEDGLSSTVPGSASNANRTASSSADLDIYEHIEVIRGATGLTQANSEPGGTINAVRKHPTQDFQMHGYVQAGQWNNVHSMIDTSGALNSNKTIRGRLVAIGGTQDSFKNSAHSDTRTLYGVLDFDLTPTTLLRLGAMYQKTHDMPDYFGIPMATGGIDSGLPNHTYLSSSWSTLNSEKYNVFAELEHQFNDDWKISAKLNSNWNQSLQKIGGLAQLTTSYSGINTNNPNLKTNNYQNYKNSSDEVTAKIALNGKYSLFNATHDVFATLDYSSLYELSNWKSIVNNTAYNVWTFSPSQIQEPDWNKNLSYHIFYKNYVVQQAASLGTRFNFPENFHFILGGRYTQAISNGSTYYEIYNSKPDGEYAKNREVKKKKFNPYFGLTYDITPDTSVYLSHTEIFKPQSVRQITGEILEPVVGINQEVGIKSELFDHRLNASLALFNIEQQNRPLTDSRNTNFSIPEGKVRSRGVDIEISGKVNDDLAIFAGYTFNKSKYLQTESSRYIAGSNFSKHTPEHMFRLYTQYQLPGVFDQWSAGLGVSTQTETSSLYDIRQGGYTLWNANVRYSYSENLSFNLIGENLTNKRYYENNRVRMNGGNNFIGDPRSLLFRVDWKY